jgi:hypothetical protein
VTYLPPAPAMSLFPTPTLVAPRDGPRFSSTCFANAPESRCTLNQLVRVAIRAGWLGSETGWRRRVASFLFLTAQVTTACGARTPLEEPSPSNVSGILGDATDETAPSCSVGPLLRGDVLCTWLFANMPPQPKQSYHFDLGGSHSCTDHVISEFPEAELLIGPPTPTGPTVVNFHTTSVGDPDGGISGGVVFPCGGFDATSGTYVLTKFSPYGGKIYGSLHFELTNGGTFDACFEATPCATPLCPER